jgi:hypothetical protein
MSGPLFVSGLFCTIFYYEDKEKGRENYGKEIIYI